MNPAVPRITPDPIPPARRSRRGSVLIAAALFAFVFGLISGWTIVATQRQMRATWQARILENSLNASASQVRSMFQQAETIIKNRPPQFFGNLANINPAVMGIQPNTLPGYTQVTDSSNNALSFIRPLGANDLQFRPVNVSPGDALWPTLRDWTGYQLATLSYEIYSVLSEASPNAVRLGFPGAGFRKQISFLYVPLYQYAIFYDNSLELHNGPIMDIRGRVHTNKDLFLSSIGGLTFWDSVTAVRSLNSYNDFTTRNINANNSQTANRVQFPFIFPLESYNNYGRVSFPAADSNFNLNTIQTGNFNSLQSSFVNMVVEAGDARDTNNNRALDSGDAAFASFSQTLWGNSLRDGSRGVNPVTLPLPPDARAQADDPNRVILNRVLPTDSPEARAVKYENVADIRILGDPGNPSTIRILDRNNNVLPNVFTRTNGTTASIFTVTEHFDGQQLTVVRKISVDMANVNERFGNTFLNGEGVLYISTTPVPENGENWTNRDNRDNWLPPGRDNFMPAVEIINATTLPRNSDNAFTIATDRPLYQVGNFNTVNKVTAVMAADAITITSQQLTLQILDPATGAVIQPGNTREGISTAANATARTHLVNPTALSGDLITNSILVMGDTPTKYKDPAVVVTPSNADQVINRERLGPNWVRVQQSGGAHNVIRYAEALGGRTHRFNGSMLVLFESKYARNAWFNRNFTHNGVNVNAYYGPPNRNYLWDPSLATSTPPRGMLFLIVVEVGELERISPLLARQVRANM
jgi:hypothetical protein